MMRPATRSRNWAMCAALVVCIYVFGFSENASVLYFRERPDPTSDNTINILMHNNEYCIGYNFLEATDSFRENGLEPITLAIHGTSEMMKLIENKPFNWDGPISLGLFLDFHSRQALDYIADVHRCDEEFRRKVTVHFAFRLSVFQDKCPLIKSTSKNRECKEFLDNRDQYRKLVVGSFQLYPSNLMRNIARHGAKSDIHFIADVDMMMSENFARRVKPIANELIDGKSKKLLVVRQVLSRIQRKTGGFRRFETNQTIIPQNVKQLSIGMKNKNVFEFHHKFFFEGHKINNISHWLNISTSSNEISSWEIPYTSSLWEVQVILHRNDLYNADYFPARVKVMQSLIYSLCRANYTFNLLSHVFNVHEGIKMDDTHYSKSVISHSQKYGKRIAFNRYVKEMNESYPLTYKRCGKFVM